MSKLTKNQKLVAGKIEAGKAYTLKEASALVKEITTTKFDASVDIDVRLGVDPRKANQMVRGVVSLPNGTGKVTRVLCLCTPDAETAAKEAFLPEDSIRCSWRQALVKRKALEIADSAQEIAIRPRECGQPGGCRRNATHPWHPQILLFQLLIVFHLI